MDAQSLKEVEVAGWKEGGKSSDGGLLSREISEKRYAVSSASVGEIELELKVLGVCNVQKSKVQCRSDDRASLLCSRKAADMDFACEGYCKIHGALPHGYCSSAIKYTRGLY